ncbi:MAG: hypothetical protein GXY55_05450 [Phycisphaerae bacterium]|nr:hypothetical protein [Phycisphaerae bacterium]
MSFKKTLVGALMAACICIPATATDMSMHLWVNGQPMVTAAPGDTLNVNVMLLPTAPIRHIEFDLVDEPVSSGAFIATSMACHATDCMPVNHTPIVLPTYNGDFGGATLGSSGSSFPSLPDPAFTITLQIASYSGPGMYRVMPSNVVAHDSSFSPVNVTFIEPLLVQIGSSTPPPQLGHFNWEIAPVAASYYSYYADHSLAFLPSGQPAVAFVSGYYGGRKLSYAWHDGTSWCVEDIAAFYASYCSMKILPNGRPAISVYDENSSSGLLLRYFWHDGTTWQGQVVDSGPHVGACNSMAILPNGQPAISYYDAGNGALKYAQFDGASWQVEVVDATGIVGLYTSLVILPDGTPAISYYDSSSADLKYAWHDGTGWQTTIVDSLGNVGTYTSLAVLPNGHPAISYADYTNQALKYAWFDGTDWQRQNAGGSQTPVGGTSLAMLPNGQPAIAFRSYANSTSDLHYTVWNGSEWKTTYVDVMGDTGHNPCLAIAPDGQPAISFLDDNQYRICLAKYVPRPASPVQMDSNYAAYAETEWSAPVTNTNSPAHSEGTGWAVEPQGTAATSELVTVPEGHLRTNIILQGQEGADQIWDCIMWDPETMECMEWGFMTMPQSPGRAEGSVVGTLSIGVSTMYPDGTPLELTCQAPVRGPTSALEAYELKVTRGDNTIALIDAANPQAQTVTVTAGEQLGFSVAGAATWWYSYEIHVDGRFILSATSGATPPQVTAAVSRRTHNGNPFDISVWSANNPVECRVGGPQQIVVSFDQPVARVTGTDDDVLLSSGALDATDGLVVDGDTLTVNLSGATNGANLLIEFPGIAATGDPTATAEDTLCLGVLAGDANGDLAVNIFDLVLVRNQLNQPVAAASFRADVNADGSINIFDLVGVRNSLNTSIATACP